MQEPRFIEFYSLENLGSPYDTPPFPPLSTLPRSLHTQHLQEHSSNSVTDILRMLFY